MNLHLTPPLLVLKSETKVKGGLSPLLGLAEQPLWSGTPPEFLLPVPGFDFVVQFLTGGDWTRGVLDPFAVVRKCEAQPIFPTGGCTMAASGGRVFPPKKSFAKHAL